MIIKANKILFDNKEEYSYKVTSIDKCCGNIIKVGIPIELNKEYDEILMGNEYSLKLVRTDAYYLEGYGNEYEKYYYTIKCCPFCGEKIDVEIIETIDKSEEYALLQQKRNQLWNECKTTDSISKKNELQNEVHLLDKQINEFWYSDGLK